AGAQPRRGGGSLASGMAGSDHDHVKPLHGAQSMPVPLVESKRAAHGGNVSRETSSRRPALLPDAEIPENDVKQVLDVDPAGEAAEGAGGEPDILGRELRQLGRPATPERRQRLGDRLAV